MKSIDNEKLKGVTKKAKNVNIDTYYYENFNSMSMQVNKYGMLDGQIIDVNVKVVNKSRKDYTKAYTRKTTQKSIRFMTADKIRNEYNNLINDYKVIIDSSTKNYRYVEQLITPYSSNMYEEVNRKVVGE